MKIAIITEGFLPELSGVTISLQQRLKVFSQQGHEVRVFAPDYQEAAHLYPNYRQYVGEIFAGVEVISYPSRPYYVDYARDPKPFTFSVIEKELVSFDPDLVHVECAERLFLGFLTRAGIGWARKHQRPATAVYHTNYLAYIEDYKKDVAWLRLPGIESLLRQVVIWVYNSYDATFVSSPTTQNYLQQQGIRNTQFGYFNGVDTDHFHPEKYPLPEEYRPFADRIKVVYIGRLSPDKQISQLLQSFDLVRQRTNRCHFVIIGSGPEEPAVRQWANKHNDAYVAGRLPHEMLGAYFAHADIFVTASPKENDPLSIMEAMASGLPVVGPRAGGLIDLIEPGVTGLPTAVDDPHDIAQAIHRLVTDHPLRQQMGQNGHLAIQKRSWQRSATEMLAFWESLLTSDLQVS